MLRLTNFTARLLTGLVCLVAFTATASADRPGSSDPFGLKPKSKSVPKVQFTAKFEPADAAPGDTVQLLITAKVEPGYYIYSLTQGPGGKRTVVSAADFEGLVETQAEFSADPQPTIVDVEADTETLRLEKHSDQVVFSRSYMIPQGYAGQRIAASVQVEYGVCDKDLCEYPDPFHSRVELQLAQAGRRKPAPAQDAEGDVTEFVQDVSKKTVARWSVEASPRQVRPGERITVTVTAQLANGFHVYALDQKVTDDGGPMRSAIRLTDVGGSAPSGAFAGPKPKTEVSEEFGGLELRFHEGRVTWSQSFAVPISAPTGPLNITGGVAYQVCNESGCQQPTGFEFGGAVQVAAKGSPGSVRLNVLRRFKSAEAGDFVEESPIAAAAPEAESPEPAVSVAASDNDPRAQGLVMFLVTAALAGFAALLTPCVFPMVPITVSYFLKQSEKEHHQPVVMASVYCLGIIGTFTGLGILMAALFGATKINTIANDPWLNLTIAGVMIFFALNLLGLFEIRIPSSLLTLSAGQESRGGYLGVLFMALTFTLTSFTCTFAFVGSLLVVAAKGDRLWPILGVLVFSAAFSLPFFFLALFPSLLKKLPKSGGWMNMIKVTMGLIEIGAAFKFLSVADLSWNPEPMLFDFELVLSAWIVILFTTGLYLLNMFRTAHDTPNQNVGAVQLVAAMTFMGVGAYFTVGLLAPNKPTGVIWENVVAFLPPRFEAGDGQHERLGPVLEHGGLIYALDIEKALQVAIQDKRPMLLDFTGVNCINCRKMELGPLSAPEIKERLKDFVLVQVYLDNIPKISDSAERKRLLERNRHLQENWFGDVTLPAYAVVPAGHDVLERRESILAVVQGLQETARFAEFLDAGIERWNKHRADPLPAQRETAALEVAGTLDAR